MLGRSRVQDECDFESRLQIARTNWDMRAARLACSPRDWAAAPLLAEVCQYAIGHAVATIDQAGEPGVQELPARWIGGNARDALRRLIDGAVEELVFLHLGPDGIAGTVVNADDLGAPRIAARMLFNWNELVAGLAIAAPLRAFQLAGGQGHTTFDWAAFEQGVDRTLATVVDRTCSQAIVVLEAIPGWRVSMVTLDRLGQLMPQSLHVESDWPVDGADHHLAQLLANAPLRYPYELAFANLDPRTGIVQITSHVLFQPGTSAQQGAKARVRAIAPAISGAVTLAVVVRLQDAPERWRLVGMGALNARPNEQFVIEVTLDGPGQVHFTAPSGVRDLHESWDQVVRNVPRQVNLHTAQTDLVVALELGGSSERVMPRLQRAHELVERLIHVAGGTLRVGLIGYADHPMTVRDGRPVEPDAPVQMLGLGDPDTAMAALGQWEPHALHDDFAAPLEDALFALRGMRWRSASRRFLVLFASRPPHPWSQLHDRAQPCTHSPRLDWELQYATRVELDRVHCVAVTDPPPWSGRENIIEQSLESRFERTWRLLGRHAHFDLESASVAEIASVIADPLAVAQGFIPLPLPAYCKSSGVGQ
jgi:hypothetical protein